LFSLHFYQYNPYFRHQLYRERDVAAVFLPHQGLPLAQGLIVVMTLVKNLVFIL
jgi:hypothetical protein